MAVFTAIAAAFGKLSLSLFAKGAFSKFLIKTGARLITNFLVAKLTQRKQNSVFGTSGKLTTGEDAPRRVPFGVAATEGQLVYASYWGQFGKAPNAHLTQVIALSHLPVKGLIAVMVDGVYCTPYTGAPSPPPALDPITGLQSSSADALGAAAFATVSDGNLGTPLAEFRVAGVNYAWVKFYDGTQTAADPLLTGQASHPDHPWGADRIGRGIAYAVVTTRVSNTLFSGFPRFRFVLDSIRLYDPSRDTTIGGVGAQRWADPATWGGDGDYLPVVQAYNTMRGLFYGSTWQYGFQGLGLGRLPASDWIARINECRASIVVDGTPRPRFRSGGMLTFDSSTGDALEAIMASANGRIADIGGIYKPAVAVPRAPVAHIEEADIVATEPHSFRPIKRLAEKINAAVAQYPEPEEGFNLREAPSLINPDLEIEDRSRRLQESVQIPNVPYAEQVQRIMQMAVADARAQRRHTFTLAPKFYGLEPNDVVTFTSARMGYSAKHFRVESVSLRADCHVLIDMIETDPADYDLDAWDGYLPVDTRPATFPTLIPVALSGVTVTAVTALDADSVARRPGIQVAWVADDPSAFSGVKIHLSLAVSPESVRTFTHQALGEPFVTYDGILPATGYLVRVEPIAATPTQISGYFSVTTSDVRIGIDDLAPAAVTQILDDAAGMIDAASSAIEADLTVIRADITSTQAQAGAAQTAVANEAVQRANEDVALAGHILDLEAAYSTGRGVLTSAFLETQIGRWAAQGSMTTVDNDVHAVGKTRIFTVTSIQSDGLQAASNDPAQWVGVADAEAYVVEVDFTLTAGSLDSSALYVSWVNTSGVNHASWARLSTSVAAPVILGRMVTARALLKRPAFAGIFSYNIAHVLVNWAPLAPMSAKTMRVHRWEIRAATAQEIATGIIQEDLTTLQAAVTAEQIARANADSALAADIDTVQAQVGTVQAEVTSQAIAIADIEGNAAASFVMRARAGGAVGEVEVVAGSDPSGAAASAVVMRADRFSFEGGIAFFDGGLSSDDFVPGVSGWQIDAAGNAEFTNLIKRSDLQVGSVTDEFRAYAPGPFTRFTIFPGQEIFNLSVTGMQGGDIWRRTFHFDHEFADGQIIVLESRSRRNGGAFTGWEELERMTINGGIGTWNLRSRSSNLSGEFDEFQYRARYLGPNNGYNGDFLREIYLTVGRITR